MFDPSPLVEGVASAFRRASSACGPNHGGPLEHRHPRKKQQSRSITDATIHHPLTPDTSKTCRKDEASYLLVLSLGLMPRLLDSPNDIQIASWHACDGDEELKGNMDIFVPANVIEVGFNRQRLCQSLLYLHLKLLHRDKDVALVPLA